MIKKTSVSSKVAYGQGYAPSIWIPKEFAKSTTPLAVMDRRRIATFALVHDRRAKEEHEDNEAYVITGHRPEDLRKFARAVFKLDRNYDNGQKAGDIVTMDVSRVLVWHLHGLVKSQQVADYKRVEPDLLDKIYKARPELTVVDGFEFGLRGEHIGPYILSSVVTTVGDKEEKYFTLEPPTAGHNPFV